MSDPQPDKPLAPVIPIRHSALHGPVIRILDLVKFVPLLGETRLEPEDERGGA